MARILYNSKFTLTSKIAGNKQCRYKEGWLYKHFDSEQYFFHHKTYSCQPVPNNKNI